MKLMTTILAAAALVLAGPALGDTPRHASKEKAGASTGSSAPSLDGTDARSGIDLDAAFKKADIDGDNAVSKAEAAGNERLVTGFDRADRNHDGKLSRAEFDSIYHPKAKAKAKTKRAAANPSASRGGSRKE